MKSVKHLKKISYGPYKPPGKHVVHFKHISTHNVQKKKFWHNHGTKFTIWNIKLHGTLLTHV